MWACCTPLIGVIILGVAAFSRRPVLIHLWGEGDCACGDFHEKVSGLVIRNPLRNRQPERVAGDLLDGLRMNRCVENAAVCEYALAQHRVSDWRLVNREDAEMSVRLYFKLTKYGTSDPAYRLTGEGMVQVERRETGWRVVSYSSYF